MSIDQPGVPGRLLRPSLGAAVAALLVALALVAPVAAVAGPTKLSDPAVSPRVAVPGETIVFSVTYRNREGSPPDEVRVSIGGSVHAMAPTQGDEAWKQGVRFTVGTTVPLGSHAVVFSATDRERFTDQVDGGIVTVAAPPAADPVPAPTVAPMPTPTPPAPSTSSPSTSTPSTSNPTAAPPASSGATDSAPGASDADDEDFLAPARPSPGSGDPADPTDPTGPTDPDASAPDGAGAAPGAPGAPGASGGSASGDDSTDPASPANPGDPTTAGRGPGVATSGGWGDLARALESLGIDAGRSQLISVLPTVVGTAGGVTLLMAFMFFGKKRRDGEPPAPDEVLHTRSARGTNLPGAGELVPDGGSAGPGARLPLDAEAALPRWRRPSLLEARKKDPLRDAAAPPPSLSFDHGLVGLVEGRERRVIRYRVVRLLDAPDELRSAEIGFLDQGDEVQLLERSGTYWLVLCPDGRRGWLHKMTLGDVVGDEPAPGPRETWATNGKDVEAGVDDDVLAAFLAARGRA